MDEEPMYYSNKKLMTSKSLKIAERIPTPYSKARFMDEEDLI